MLGLSDAATHDEPISTGPAGRIVAQRGLFTGPSLLVPEDLYAPVERGAARRERHRVELGPATAVTTNTYFGRFHATYWQRWTAAADVEVQLAASGSGRVRLMASDTNKVWRIVDAAQVEGTEDGAAARPDRPVRRRRRHVAGVHHRDRLAHRLRRALAGHARAARPPTSSSAPTTGWTTA